MESHAIQEYLAKLWLFVTLGTSLSLWIASLIGEGAGDGKTFPSIGDSLSVVYKGRVLQYINTP